MSITPRDTLIGRPTEAAQYGLAVAVAAKGCALLIDSDLFSCPFVSTLNSNVEQTRVHSLAWIQQMGIVSSTSSVQHVDTYRLDRYSARICPTAPAENLDLLNDWVAWGTLLDDRFETRDPGAIRAALDNMTLLLQDGELRQGRRDGIHAFAFGLANLWQRTLAVAPGTRQRIAADLIRWLETYDHDAHLRRDGAWPSVENYLEHRIWAGAVPAYMGLTEVATGNEVSEPLRSLPVVQDLRRAAAEHICMVNDVYGVEREQSRGDVVNILLVLEHHQGFDRRASVGHVQHLANETLNTFCSLEDQLLSIVAGTRGTSTTQVARMVAGLRAWISGNLEWHRNFESERYNERGCTALN